jgi:hypothetical protein
VQRRTSQSQFRRKTVVVQGSRSRSNWFVNQNQVSHSRREDTRSPVRNGASLKQSLFVRCYNCNRSAKYSNYPIQNPLLLVTQTPHTWKCEYLRLNVASFVKLCTEINESILRLSNEYAWLRHIDPIFLLQWDKSISNSRSVTLDIFGQDLSSYVHFFEFYCHLPEGVREDFQFCNLLWRLKQRFSNCVALIRNINVIQRCSCHVNN